MNKQANREANRQVQPQISVRRRTRTHRPMVLILLFCLGLSVAFGGLHWWRSGREVANSQAIDAQQISNKVLPLHEEADADLDLQIEKLQLIYSFLKENYYRELTDSELVSAMYAGLLNELESPYTFYMNQDDYAAMEESFAGEYCGIGAQVTQRDGIYMISDIFDDSPAAKAGLRNGDQFLKVDGKSVDQFGDVSLLAAAVRGEEGSQVVLDMYRPSEGKEYRFELTRATVDNTNVKYEMLNDQVGYVRVLQFSNSVNKNFRRALDDLAAKGAKGVIFDLRNNGGGYVTEVTAMLDYLLDDAVIAVAKGRADNRDFSEEWKVRDGIGVPEDWRYVVLVNEYSASASELFSGCLRDLKQTPLIGHQTFGKGVGTVTIELDDGSAMQVTNFHYYLPSGKCVDGDGLVPDREVDLAEDLRGLPLGQVDHELDDQLQAALEEIQKQLAEDTDLAA